MLKPRALDCGYIGYAGLHKYVCIYIYTYIYTDIYIDIYISDCVPIYIYREREREGEREGGGTCGCYSRIVGLRVYGNYFVVAGCSAVLTKAEHSWEAVTHECLSKCKTVQLWALLLSSRGTPLTHAQTCTELPTRPSERPVY